MQATDFERFAALMNGMGQIYDREIDDVLLDTYWLVLQDWSLAEFEYACGHLLRTKEFMPRPSAFAELRKLLRPNAGEAWQRVIDHCASGAWRSGRVLGQPGIDDVVKMLGGYETIALHPKDKLTFIERRFCEHYQAAEDRAEALAALAKLSPDECLRFDAPRRLT